MNEPIVAGKKSLKKKTNKQGIQFLNWPRGHVQYFRKHLDKGPLEIRGAATTGLTEVGTIDMSIEKIRVTPHDFGRPRD